MDKTKTADIRKKACETYRKEYMVAENGNRITLGQIHWKGRAYPVREIDACNRTFRVSVKSLRRMTSYIKCIVKQITGKEYEKKKQLHTDGKIPRNYHRTRSERDECGD